MKVTFLGLILLLAQSKLAAAAKVGEFEIKRYTDEKSIVKLLTSEIDVLEDSACISSIVDSPVHNALTASGRYIQSITLKLVPNPEGYSLGVSVEYATVRSKEASTVVKNTQCPLTETSAGTTNSNNDGF